MTPTCMLKCIKCFALFSDQRCKLANKEHANVLLAIRNALAVMGIAADINILTCEYKGIAGRGSGLGWHARATTLKVYTEIAST